MNKEHTHLGSKRIEDKEIQQTYVCLKQIKNLNYPRTDSRSQATTLCIKNQKLIEKEEEAKLIEQFEKTKDITVVDEH